MNFRCETDNMLNKSKRLLLGALILVLVDVIWVSCSELNKYVHQHEKFEKPFFVTYVKTSLFTLYLFAVCLWPSWKDNFQRSSDYTYITEDVDDDTSFLRGSIDSKLSSPSYVPIKFGNKSSGTESDDSTISRSVRFKKLAEVRQMSEEEATEALLARLSYSATIRISKAIPFTPSNKLTVFQTAWLSLPFGFLWFISNYTMHTASLKSKFSNQAVFSASAATFVMTLSAMFPVRPCDKFTLTKFIVVLVTVSSLCMITFSDTNAFSTIEWRTRSSVLLTVFSSFLFSLYVVFLMNNADHEEKLDIPLLCGFTGLFCLTILWPGFLLLHFIKWELFEWPSMYQWSFLLVDGLLGTMLSQVLWLWGCFLTSSLLATVALSLTVPLCILMDAFLFDVKHTSLLYLGLVPIFIFFFILVILTYLPNADPVFDLLCRLWALMCKSKTFRMSEYDLEQSESLIGINDTDIHEA